MPKVTLTNEQKKELLSIDRAQKYHSDKANNYLQAVAGINSRRKFLISKYLLDHGIANAEVKNVDLEKGEVEVSNVKKPSRNELALLKSGGLVTEEQARKIIKK